MTLYMHQGSPVPLSQKLSVELTHAADPDMNLVSAISRRQIKMIEAIACIAGVLDGEQQERIALQLGFSRSPA